jgi:hypothetical protein|uniref:Uncharacterized protein n=1 Tax=Sipha flava TaxID=143950 RepID=A0A2S2Q0W9_9HEMI
MVFIGYCAVQYNNTRCVRVRAQEMKLSTRTNQSKTGSAAAKRPLYVISLFLFSPTPPPPAMMLVRLYIISHTRTHTVSFYAVPCKSTFSFRRNHRGAITPRSGSQVARVFYLRPRRPYRTIAATNTYCKCVRPLSPSPHLAILFVHTCACTGTRVVRVTIFR